MGLEEKHSWRLSIALGLLLAVVSFLSLFVGVMDMTPGELFAGNAEQFELFLISRLPRLLAILCTGRITSSLLRKSTMHFVAF